MTNELPLLDVELPGGFEVRGILSSDGFFPALLDLLPAGSRACLQHATGRDVQAFLEARAVSPAFVVPRGSGRGRPETPYAAHAWHLPVDAVTMEDVAQRAETLAEIELCEHVVAYRGEVALLVAYDVFMHGAAIQLAPSVDETRVAAFCARLHASYVRRGGS